MLIKFTVTGMTCAACSARVEKVTSQVPGVKRADVNLLAGSMVVEADNSDISDTVISAVKAAGYDAFLPGKKQTEQKAEHGLREMKIRIIGSAVFLVILMYFTMGHMLGLPLPAW